VVVALLIQRPFIEILSMSSPVILSIDQGTTSARAVVYDAASFRELGSAAREIAQHYPQPGWVEHDAEEIWASVGDVVPRALTAAKVEAKNIAAIGITNQRETVLLWDRNTGKPIGRAIVWQDRRTTDWCKEHAAEQPFLQARTGLVLDPYFSATKIRWMLEGDASLRMLARNAQLACGNIDTWLIWNLTGRQAHVTDVTNASRTLLYNIHLFRWDEELCRYFGVPAACLPQVKLSAEPLGTTKGLGFLPDGIPITGVAGDQQAALFGQCAFEPGEAKCTYGTGAFFLLHTGTAAVASKHQLLTTIAAMTKVEPRYALEGSVFVAGAAVQWLRDGLNLFTKAEDTLELAMKSNPAEPVLFVPAFVGLGSPYWEPEARGAMLGLTRGTTKADVARAALEGVAYQVADLIDAARADMGAQLTALRVDGGMARNDWFLQCQADTLGLPVLRSPASESTALGAAFLAGIGAGLWKGENELRKVLSEAKRFEPKLAAEERDRRLARWRKAVQAVVAFARE
jgi:glycerol kinase